MPRKTTLYAKFIIAFCLLILTTEKSVTQSDLLLYVHNQERVFPIYYVYGIDQEAIPYRSAILGDTLRFDTTNNFTRLLFPESRDTSNSSESSVSKSVSGPGSGGYATASSGSSNCDDPGPGGGTGPTGPGARFLSHTLGNTEGGQVYGNKPGELNSKVLDIEIQLPEISLVDNIFSRHIEGLIVGVTIDDDLLRACLKI